MISGLGAVQVLTSSRTYKDDKDKYKIIVKELRSWLEEEINNIETLFGGETSMTIGYKTVLSKLNELENNCIKQD